MDYSGNEMWVTGRDIGKSSLDLPKIGATRVWEAEAKENVSSSGNKLYMLHFISIASVHALPHSFLPLLVGAVWNTEVTP